MYSGTPAFGLAKPSDPYYRLMCTNKHNIFWGAHSRNRKKKLEFFTEDFRDLINAMIAFDPA